MAALSTAVTVTWSDLGGAAAAGPSLPSVPLNHFPQSVHEYYLREIREAERRGRERQAELKTKGDAEGYVREARSKIARCFGAWPERTPLNPRTTGVIKRGAYRIEKVIFESRPRFYVTANLYVPDHAAFPAPGVVGACGHFASGKAYPEYQSFAQGLARQGYVVLIFDAISLGERLQLPGADLKSRIGGGSREHSLLGDQQFLVDEFLGSWFAWDGIRALDYLLSREEVDPRHVGVTGNSGGGMETTWLCGADQRWTMAAPNCFITTFCRLFEDEASNDTEQCPPHSLALGLDHCDFLAALAPKPIIVLAQEEDFVDVRGTIEAFDRLRRLYGLLGAADHVKLYIGAGEHGYPQPSREAMYGWFNHATGRGDVSAEPKLTLEDERALWCTKTGQVVELDSRPVYSYTKESAERLADARGGVSGEALRRAIVDVLKLPARRGPVDYRILRMQAAGYPLPFASSYALESERGIPAVVYRLNEANLYSRPPRQSNPAILYVAHDSSDMELREEPLVREVLKADSTATLYTCDVRGLGESRPNTFGQDSYKSSYGCDYMYAIHAIMLDRPYLGGRTHDVLSALDWLLSLGHGGVHLVANGYAAIPAALAAVLHDGVGKVTLKHAPTSYHDIAKVDLYKWPLSSFIPGVLKHFDLPDVYRELNSKKLRQIEPWDPTCGTHEG
ncbi:MAG TPA: prolyl oligopeptidase family serine peptidase [Pirellulales bacterium]|nr:prolyl oligopeptidase family serine peptidase [Pirellulales bacterium]